MIKIKIINLYSKRDPTIRISPLILGPYTIEFCRLNSDLKKKDLELGICYARVEFYLAKRAKFFIDEVFPITSGIIRQRLKKIEVIRGENLSIPSSELFDEFRGEKDPLILEANRYMKLHINGSSKLDVIKRNTYAAFLYKYKECRNEMIAVKYAYDQYEIDKMKLTKREHDSLYALGMFMELTMTRYRTLWELIDYIEEDSP